MTEFTWGGRREGAGRKKAPTDPQAIKARMTLQSARAKKLIFEAHLAELEYRERRAGLVSQTTITRVIDDALAAVRAEFDPLPADLAQQIAASSDAREIDHLLASEIRRRLDAVTELPSKKVTA